MSVRAQIRSRASFDHHDRVVVDGVVVGRVDDFDAGQPHIVDVNGTSAVIVRYQGSFFAMVNACPHLRRDLRNAHVKGPHIVCPAHLGAWDVRTGNPSRPTRQISGASGLNLLAVEVVTEDGVALQTTHSRHREY